MDIFGLIGFPLTHSFSSRFFTKKFEQERIDAEYLNFELSDISKIKEIVLQNPNMKGLNVTIPYKEKVLPFLDKISVEAMKIGAVNTIKIKQNRLTGYNTDYIGFKKSIKPLLYPVIHKKALILGTGGASKAVAQALNDLEIDWKHVSRSLGKDKLRYSSLSSEIISEYKIIINASPVGTYPNVNACPDILYRHLTKNHLLYDLVYNPEETLFLKKGKAQGATIKNGYEMLVLQAEAAWKIWTE